MLRIEIRDFDIHAEERIYYFKQFEYCYETAHNDNNRIDGAHIDSFVLRHECQNPLF